MYAYVPCFPHCVPCAISHPYTRTHSLWPTMKNGALLYPTETEGPPMAGWVHNREAGCVVCAANTLKVATFVRWGRTSCTGISNVKELYNGWVGSGNAGHAGSGSNYLCMASNPEYAAGYNDGSQDAALIYRTEYETSGYGVSTLNPLHNHEAACAVCEIPAEKIMMSELLGCLAVRVRVCVGQVVITVSVAGCGAHIFLSLSPSPRQAHVPRRPDIPVRRVPHVHALQRPAPQRVYLRGQVCRADCRVECGRRGRCWPVAHGDGGPTRHGLQPRLGGALRRLLPPCRLRQRCAAATEVCGSRALLSFLKF